MTARPDPRPVPIDPDRPASGPEAGDRPGPLVSVAWLRAHLADPDLLLVQVSPTRRIYHRRHLPGAAYADLHRELAQRDRDPATGDAEREWLLPSREHVEAALARWGAGEPTASAITAPGPAARAPRVVFYDDVGQNRQAIRGYWLLRLYRYPAGRVHVLDGGLPAWTAAGAPVTDADPRPPRSTGHARAGDGPGATDAAPPGAPIPLGPLDRDLIATADQVLAWSAEASVPGGPTRILDVRTADEFVGFDDRGARHGGRIPGARNRLFSDFLRPDNTLRPVPEALALLRGSGVDPDEVRAVYCQGGVRAALGWFVLHELAGLDGVRNYAGSWEEWGNRDDLPIASDVPVAGASPAAAIDAPAPTAVAPSRSPAPAAAASTAAAPSPSPTAAAAASTAAAAAPAPAAAASTAAAAAPAPAPTAVAAPAPAVTPELPS